MELRRIAIVGPESTGKSTLARQLADHLDTVWVPEYARAYIETLQRPYGPDDLLAIARGQLAAETAAKAHARQWLICDTNLMVIRVWAMDKHPEVLPQIEAMEDYSIYDLHLLLRPDLPWEADPLREDEKRRDYLFDQYQCILEEKELAYVIVEGSGLVRLEAAMKALGIEIPS